MHRVCPTVLIADGDTIWIVSMARLLESEGYRVLRARTGVDALYQARMRRPDLVILDVMMPGIDGIGMVRDRAMTIRKTSVFEPRSLRHLVGGVVAGIAHFEAPYMDGIKVTIAAEEVRKKLATVVKDQDLSRYIL